MVVLYVLFWVIFLGSFSALGVLFYSFFAKVSRRQQIGKTLRPALGSFGGSLDQQPALSVIICAHNEQANLPALLGAITRQDYPGTWELIVVNDRSTDGTATILADAALLNPRLRILTIEHTPSDWSPKKYALSQGIAYALYEHLVFTDADCIPASVRWLSLIADQFAQGCAIVIGYSPYLPAKGLLNGLIRYETWLSAVQNATFSSFDRPLTAVGRNLAYTKTVYDLAGGFYHHRGTLSGDDDILVTRVGPSVRVGLLLETDGYVFSHPKNSWGAYLEQRTRHVGASKFYPFYTKAVQLILKLFPLLAFVAMFLYPFQSLLYFVIRYLILWHRTKGAQNNGLKTDLTWAEVIIYDLLLTIWNVFLGLAVIFRPAKQWR